jgi:superfamily II DNA or RNA helicase
MEFYVKNNICLLKSVDDFQTRNFVLQYLTTYQKVKRRIQTIYGLKNTYQNEPVALYTLVRHGRELNYIFPRGLYDIIPDNIKSQIKTVNKSTNKFSVSNIDIDRIKGILQPYSGFDLRDDQVKSVVKSLYCKRGIDQLATGAGKTEVMSGIIKYLVTEFPDIKVLVIEPTDVLVNGTSERFNRYKLDSVTYKESRQIDHTITVSHPTSLLNDTEEGLIDLSKIDVVFWDEAQHCKCETWRKLNSELCNVEYAIGLSALAVNENHINTTNVNVLSDSEAMIIGSTGRVISYVPTKYYIEKGILATPVVFQFHNELGGLLKEDNWQKLRKYGIESESRSKLIAKVTALFNKYSRRVLILVGTKTQAFDIASKLADILGSSSSIAISFGSNESYTLDENDYNKHVTYKKIDKDSSIVKDFDKGIYDILISTNHLDEGVDLSNLDVSVMASGGKKDRRIIQRVGRALRRTKTGKFAYIVDFTDNGNGVLTYHSNLRMKMYEDLIEVPGDLIYKDLSLDDAESAFRKLEEIK